jgi:nitroreductase
MDLYEVMLRRRSIRSFAEKEIPEEIVERFADVAVHAPSGGNIQPLSIILVQDGEGREKLAELSGGQPWVRKAPLSMIFCVDFRRIKRWAELSSVEFTGERAFNHFLIAYADLMAAGQNVVILAESLDLGSVYVGSVLNEIDGLRAHFDMPGLVLPLMVLSLGYPKSVPRRIPKLRKETMVHREKYRDPDPEEIRQAYDAKYGEIDPDLETYLEKAFVEALEADRLEEPKYLDRVRKEMARLEIRNNAQFLFKVRYPSKVMVRMNRRLFDAFRRAGFDFFPRDEAEGQTVDCRR